MPDRIGFIGLGVMGRPMARNLLKAGFSLVVHSRTQPAVQRFVAEARADGEIAAASSPAEVAGRSDVVITMLPDSPDVRLVVAGSKGVFETLRAGTVIIDMSTISPAVARELAGEAERRGAAMLDAPVSGGEIGAVNGTLSIMVGGDALALERVRPVLNAMGNPERVVHIGASGAGQVCKACNQLAIGGALATVSEVFALARKAGVDGAKVREALLGGFAASRVLEVHGERILKGNYVPGFRTRLYHKDMGIALETARQHDVPLPVSAVVQQLVNAMMSAGKADLDYSALATVLFELAGLN